jgi:hypothetical protein
MENTTTSTTGRTVERLVKGRATSDGAGVKLTRGNFYRLSYPQSIQLHNVKLS